MSWLLANTLVAALVALLALAAARWLRPAPAVMHVLWLFVLCKLATPPLLSFEVPVPLAEPAPRTLVLPLDVAPGGMLPLAPALPEPRAATPSLGTAAVATWAAGAAAMLAWLACGLWRGHRRVRALPPVPAALRREVEALAARIGVRVPELLDDPAAPSPYVWSFGRTRLVLPVRTLAAAPANGRAAVLAHELAHVRRGDPWFLRLELLLAVALWWHPLFWLARSQARLWSELACDAWAIACVPGASLDYATVLVDAVSRPDLAVAAPAVLAARPAARAAFERRLTMILNENVPARHARGGWWSAAALALGLFTLPVAAQREPQPVRVEVRVNGKAVGELSPAERTALLRELLRAEEREEAVERDDPQPPRSSPRPDRTKARKPAKPAERVAERAEAADTGAGAGDVAERMGAHEHHAEAMRHVHEALREAHVEIHADPDLRELGITDEVSRLVEDVVGGKGIDGGLDALIRSAMKGASRMAAKELADDEDLQRTGLGDGLTKMIEQVINDEHVQQAVGAFARRAMHGAMNDAKRDVRADPELRRLGVDVDVEELLDGVMHGRGHGDFDVHLQRVIEKAMRGAMGGHGDGAAHEHGGAERSGHGGHDRGDPERSGHGGHGGHGAEAVDEVPAAKKKAARKSVIR